MVCPLFIITYNSGESYEKKITRYSAVCNRFFGGDIVQHDAWDYPFEVIFNQEKARFVCKMKAGLTQYIAAESLIVVGNIYEKPEL